MQTYIHVLYVSIGILRIDIVAKEIYRNLDVAVDIERRKQYASFSQ